MQSRLDCIRDWERWAKEADYSASRMALKLGVTLRLLESFFRARLGLPPHKWMVQRRMNVAVNLLRSGNSVKIVAAELGYKQASHFSREFKRFFGIAPRDFTFERNTRSRFAFRYETSDLDTRIVWRPVNQRSNHFTKSKP